MSEQYKLSVQEELRILLDEIKKGRFIHNNGKIITPKFKVGDKLINYKYNDFDHLYPDTFIILKISEDGDRYYRINEQGEETWFYTNQIDKVYTKLPKYNDIWTQLNA